MFERRTFTLYEPVQAHKALMALWPTIKATYKAKLKEMKK